jgi:hypothetical protein
MKESTTLCDLLLKTRWFLKSKEKRRLRVLKNGVRRWLLGPIRAEETGQLKRQHN